MSKLTVAFVRDVMDSYHKGEISYSRMVEMLNEEVKKDMKQLNSQKEILDEIERCKESPYYFATTYLTVTNHRGETVPFSTPLSEENFNEIFKEYENRTTNF